MSIDDQFSWASPALRARLLTDPAAALRERGINPPADLPLPIVHEFIRVAWLQWVDGEIVPIDQFQIDPQDEGLLFGRGAWESTRTVNGVPWLWNLHLDRLRRTAELLAIDLAPARLPTSDQVADFVRSLTAQDVILRLNVSAGRPGVPGLVWMSAAPMPVPMDAIRLKSSVNPVHKGQPYLTLKTFQYATRLRIGQEAFQAGFDSALMVDSEGCILEAAHANIFLRLADGWVTPTADGGLLPGTVRQVVMQQAPVGIREQKVPLASLGEVREAFVTNSNLGIVPVSQIDAYQLRIGDETLGLKRWLEPPPPAGPQYRFRQTELARR